MFRFARDVEGIGCIRLHAVRHLEGLNAALKLRLILALFEMLLIELQKQVELSALFLWRRVAVADILDQLIDVGVLGIDVGSLEDAGEKTGLPILHSWMG